MHNTQLVVAHNSRYGHTLQNNTDALISVIDFIPHSIYRLHESAASWRLKVSISVSCVHHKNAWLGQYTPHPHHGIWNPQQETAEGPNDGCGPLPRTLVWRIVARHICPLVTAVLSLLRTSGWDTHMCDHPFSPLWHYDHRDCPVRLQVAEPPRFPVA